MNLICLLEIIVCVGSLPMVSQDYVPAKKLSETKSLYQIEYKVRSECPTGFKTVKTWINKSKCEVK